MDQPLLFHEISLTVGDLNRRLRELLESDEFLQDIWVLGEVSNLSRPVSGHLYFTLKDKDAAIPCVMWRSQVMRLKLDPRDGMAIEVHGHITFYEVGGKVQIAVDMIRPAGEGALYQEFLRLKDRLEAEGLFDPARKRPIPGFPHRIGIVTSSSGAALQDMLNTIRRRFPLAEVILSPSPVQGDEAPPALVAAMERLNRLGKPDVILVARGGGSLEDLWAFNDERVARAIVASPAPVICGVGHETDFTIADFAADLRAATPTAAAELATPNQIDLRASVIERQTSLVRSLESLVEGLRWQIENLAHRLQQSSPQNRILNNRQRVDELSHLAWLGIDHRLRMQRLSLEALQTRLLSLSPESVLKRGYAVVTSLENGEVITSPKQVEPGDALDVRVRDGEFNVVAGEAKQ